MIDGLLQTEAYARVLYGERRPACTEEQVDRLVAARMARQVLVRATGAGKPTRHRRFKRRRFGHEPQLHGCPSARTDPANPCRC
ncbi:Scr1 family TA system antitoxin-like transcriptional regulator [Streptomyces sp. NBC_00184]|uniref:Scr1 family TA system antitoxin-like transcriptional regulator n=1 Tax=Streptomyces sp. NBC_00184 TaxID=2975673 RepID=UPI002E2C80DC|nr:Scr1 family TA system antitoxin-like transcriptional regulator [Streptomyces sp. NBC_00184]